MRRRRRWTGERGLAAHLTLRLSAEHENSVALSIGDVEKGGTGNHMGWPYVGSRATIGATPHGLGATQTPPASTPARPPSNSRPGTAESNRNKPRRAVIAAMGNRPEHLGRQGTECAVKSSMLFTIGDAPPSQEPRPARRLRHQRPVAHSHQWCNAPKVSPDGVREDDCSFLQPPRARLVYGAPGPPGH